MDLLKRMFGMNKQPADNSATVPEEKFKRSLNGATDSGNSFKKPFWYDEESEDELFDSSKIVGFQMFTNPLEMEKYHQQEMERMMKALKQSEGLESFFDENLREEYLKPGFERFNHYGNMKLSTDVDLDGEIYPDQLHSLLQRFSGGTDLMVHEKNTSENKKHKCKLTDDEKILNQIHCIEDQTDDSTSLKPHFGNEQLNTKYPFKDGTFEGFVGGPKTLRQGYSLQISKKPNESRYSKTIIDSNGNTKTVITIVTPGGETKTQTFVNGVKVDDEVTGIEKQYKSRWIVDYGRCIQINKDGYALPKNLW